MAYKLATMVDKKTSVCVVKTSSQIMSSQEVA